MPFLDECLHRLRRRGMARPFQLPLSRRRTAEEGGGEAGSTSSSSLSTGALKQRLVGTWNQLKYSNLWLPNRRNAYEGGKDIVLLGQSFQMDGSEQERAETFSAFFSAYYSRIWLTYRTGFSPLDGTSLTSDCGWGCMLRSCQMMLAQAILVARLGREWRSACHSRRRSVLKLFDDIERWEAGGKSGEILQAGLTSEMYESERSEEMRVENGKEAADLCSDEVAVVLLFDDVPSAPLGLPALLSQAEEGTKAVAGKWFTPSRALVLSRRCLRRSPSPLTSDFSSLLCTDGRVVLSEAETATANWTRKLLLFVCLRLGAHKMNECYIPHMKSLLKLETCLGIVGGRPNHSLYFIGFYDNELVCLDPHVAHAWSGGGRGRDWLDTFHCSNLSRLPMVDMDPSCAVGFLFNDKAAFHHSMSTLNQSGAIDIESGVNEDSRKSTEPLFTLVRQSESGSISLAGNLQFSHSEKLQADLHGFELIG